MNKGGRDSLRLDVAGCDAILARTCSYPADIFVSAPRVRCLVRYGSGYDNIDVEAAKKAATVMMKYMES